MSDTRKETVTLYERTLSNLNAKGEPDRERFTDAGLFRRIKWCKTHDDAKHPAAEYCWQQWAGLLAGRFDDTGCELVEVWQQQPL